MHAMRQIPRSTRLVSPLQSHSIFSISQRIPASRHFASSPRWLEAGPQHRSPSERSASTKHKLAVFGRPIAKCFLGAMLTYQILYWAWLKLETDDIKAEKAAELERLEEEVRRRTAKAS